MDWTGVIGIIACVIFLILIVLVFVCRSLILRKEGSKNKMVDESTFVSPTPIPDGRVSDSRQQRTSSYITPATLPCDGRFVKQNDTRIMRETLSYETFEVQPAYDNLYDDRGNFNPRRVKCKGLETAPRKRNNDKSNRPGQPLQENSGYQALKFNPAGDNSLYIDYEIVQPQQTSTASNTSPPDRLPNEDPPNGLKSGSEETSGYQDLGDRDTASQRKKSSYLYTYITNETVTDNRDYVDLDQ